VDNTRAGQPTLTLLGDPVSRSAALREMAALTWTLARKNFQVRYKRAALGITWAVAQPAFQAVVLTFVIVEVFHGDRGVPHYPLFVIAGVLPWTFFSQALSAGTVSVLDNGSLVRKISMPLLVFPWSSVGGVFLAFLAALPIPLVGALVVGSLDWHLVLLPLAIALQVLSVLGVATMTAGLYPAFHDIRYLVESTLLVGLYLTPVLYPPSKLPDVAEQVLRLNPLTGVLSLYRAAFLGQSVDWLSVGVAVVVSAVLLALGIAVFQRRSDEFADLV
jgi:ABC-type polysaccharide/polyol phosphate export permease